MKKYFRLFACTAILQGFALWWLNYSQDQNYWPFDPMLRSAMLFFAVVVPLVIYWTESVPELSASWRRSAVAIYGIVFSLLGAYLQWASGSERAYSLDRSFQLVLALAILCFVSVNLLIGFNYGERRWKYDQLFRYAWRNAMLVVTAFFITLAFWLVLTAGAQLMVLINVQWIAKLIAKPIFIFPATSLVVSGAFALGLSVSKVTESSQRFALFISSWLLALLLFFGVIWTGSLPFVGLDTLFKTGHTGFILSSFLVLAVAFSSCVYQDGKFALPYSFWIGRALQVAWLSLLPVAAILCWALFLRVQQYGWTPMRLWSALIAVLAVIYVVGYALSWRNLSQWMSNIGRTNMVAAVVLCLAVLALSTPIADVNRLSVASQMHRVQNQAGVLEPDWNFLRYKSGRFGQEELKKIAAGVGVPAGSNWQKIATDKLASTHPRAEIMNKGVVSLDRFNVHPKGATLPPEFLTYLQSPKGNFWFKWCVNVSGKCDVWIGDLQGDGRNNIVFFDTDSSANPATVFSMVVNTWQEAGYLRSNSHAPFTQAQLDNAETKTVEWKDLVIGSARYRFVPN